MFYLPQVALFFAIIIGVILLSWWNGRGPSRLQNTLLGAGLILGSWALLLALWGYAVGLQYEIPLLIVFVLLWIWPWKSTFAARLAAFKNHLKSTFAYCQSLGTLEVVIGVFLVIVFVVTFVLCLAPSSGNDYDSLVYHLAAPMQYLMAGHIHALPYDHHSFFPFIMEMLYLGGLQMAGPVLAKLFHWSMLPLSCLVLIAMGSQIRSRVSGFWAAAILVSLPLVLFEATTAYVDLGLVFFALLAFLCFFNWLENYSINWLALSGIFCGLCLGVKYSGVFIAFWIGLWLLGTMLQKRQWQWAGLGLFIFWTVFVGGFWYGKNIALTHNPVYPFAYSIFGGKGWTQQMATDYQADQHEFGYGRKPLDWLLLPWRLSMAPLNNIAVSARGVSLAAQPFWPYSSQQLTPQKGIANGRFDVIGLLTESIFGPLLLALCLPLILVRRKPRFVGFALWSFLFFFVLWAFGSQQMRYLLAPAALLSLAAGWMVSFCLGRSTFLKVVAVLSVVISCVFSVSYVAFQSRIKFPVILGGQTPTSYLQETFAGFDAMQWANKNTPKDAVYAIYGEPRCFYLHKKYFWADDPHNNLIDYPHIHTAQQLISALKEQGAQYALWNSTPGKNGGVFAPPAQFQEAIDQGLATMLYEAHGYQVLQLSQG